MSTFSSHRIRSLPNCSWLNDRCFAAWLISHLKPLGKSICDVGAGNGYMLRHLLPAFSEVIVTEPSPNAIKILKRRAKKMRVIQCKAEAIPLPNKAVDIAFAKSSLHHFESMRNGLDEMSRIARKAVVAVEVIAPTVPALKFAKKLLPRKEPSRAKDAVFSENDLIGKIEKVAKKVRCLHYDQFIDVEEWLTNSDLSRDCQVTIYRDIANQSGTIKRDMQIHYQEKRLVMLRRMALIIGTV